MCVLKEKSQGKLEYTLNGIKTKTTYQNLWVTALSII